ncbi:MAG: FAD-binding oxidoreductase [Actinobacteria bacterium]|nr:FAD-binding oxidoreductase [Actinomycetota bacterium]
MSTVERGPGRIERPGDLSETAQILTQTSGSVLIRGGGTKQDWAGRVHEPDLVVDTTAMDQVLTHNPGDMTVSVQAGIPLRALQEHVAGDGQWVALDPASASSGATVGGLLAAGDAGPSRLQYGGMRDLVIGATVVLADGSVARSGGHVIKNVAGYDLAKLLHGSLGTLALIGEVVLRLHPKPSTRLTVLASADAEQATAAALALAAGPLEPASVEWVSGSGEKPGALIVRVQGSGAVTEAAAEATIAALTQAGLDARTLDADEAAQRWSEHEALVGGDEGAVVVQVNGLPSELAALAAAVREHAGQAGVEASMVSAAGMGMHTLSLAPAAPEQQAQVLTGIRTYADRVGSSVLLRRRPEAFDAHIDVMGTPPSTVDLLRRIKHEFDPDSRLAPGRFAGWY